MFIFKVNKEIVIIVGCFCVSVIVDKGKFCLKF